jgi:hypothetical protein
MPALTIAVFVLVALEMLLATLRIRGISPTIGGIALTIEGVRLVKVFVLKA